MGGLLRRPQVFDTRREVIALRRRLAAHPLFSGCSRGELRTLTRWGDEIEVPPHVVLLRENSMGMCLIAVLEGSLVRTAASEQHVGHVRAGQWVGERAVLGLAPEPATVTTETTCRLFMLGRRPTLSFAPTLPGLRSALFPGLGEHEAVLRIRSWRADGVARWQELRVTRPPPAERPSMPGWSQEYIRRRNEGHAPRHMVALPRAPAPRAVAVQEARSVADRRRTAVIAAMAVTAVLAVGAATVQLPYYTMRGATASASAAVAVDGAHAEHGVILFPIVDVSRDTVLTALREWHDDGVDFISVNELLGGRSAADVERANRQLMAASQRDAMVAVSKLLGGDALASAAVTIDAGDIGGPSAGLAFALALVDQLTPGDLTGNRKVAATGELRPDGSIHAVGGIRLKAAAARRAGASIFLVPSANHLDAARSAGSMRILSVDSLAEAVVELVANGGEINAT